MKILITGTAGFIGSHLANKLLARGDEVVGLDCINEYYDIRIKYGRLAKEGIQENSVDYNKLTRSELYPNYLFIKLNLEDKDNLMNLFADQQFDAVCNLAAQAGVRYSLANPDAYIDSNITGFINILEACRHHNVKNLSYASSSSVYGLNEELPFSTEHNVDHPISLYAASKKSNELMAHAYSHLFDIATTGLRFFTVYGPWGRPDMAPFLFVKAAIDGQAIQVFNNGEMLRDFTYIDDIIEGVTRVIDNPAKEDPNWNGKSSKVSSSSAPYRIYNIGSNSPIRLMDFIAAIENETGKTIEKKMLPMQPGDMPATYADVKELVEDLKYRPTTTIEEGMSHFVNWYVEFFKVDLP
ncbi:MAG: NAD-dependent epimerase/dehydratase family protein [Methylomarinum sp.]|nr:NAD-dependent epimerase/dehydratase family protein [Methylomarinum sp.]